MLIGSKSLIQAMAESWAAYEKYAWGRDELQPLSRTGNDRFGGLGATIVDSMDTLLLMGMHEQYARCAPRLTCRTIICSAAHTCYHGLWSMHGPWYAFELLKCGFGHANCVPCSYAHLSQHATAVARAR